MSAFDETPEISRRFKEALERRVTGQPGPKPKVSMNDLLRAASDVVRVELEAEDPNAPVEGSADGGQRGRPEPSRKPSFNEVLRSSLEGEG